MRVVVGLGNPGPQYERTRHNVGFLVLDELARRWCVQLEHCSVSRAAHAMVSGKHVLLVEPQMFMNCSGESLARMELGIGTREMIVVHDDLDLASGTVRIKQNGGLAGHRGLLSLAQSFGGDFTRVRLGIGRPQSRREVIDYVLSPFGEDQIEAISLAVHVAADAVECILDQGEETAMNRFNARSHTYLHSAPAVTGRQ